MKKPLYILPLIIFFWSSCLPWDFDKVDFVQAITGGVQSVNFLTATLEGSIAGLNEGTVTQYGHVWTRSGEEPDLNKPEHGRTDLGERTTDGSFISELSGLRLNTEYRFRAYARLEGQIVYGKVNLLTTLDLELSAKVTEGNGANAKILVGNFEGPSVQLSGNVELRLLVSEHGFIWSKVHDLPELGRDFTIPLGAMADYGKFESELTGLPADSNFYLRSFVLIEGYDTLYSEVAVFHTFQDSAWRKTVFSGPGQIEFFGRNYGYAFLMNDDRVYIAGGQKKLLNGELDHQRALEIFDPAINTYVGSYFPPYLNRGNILHYQSDFHFVINDTAYISYNQRTKLASMHLSPTGQPAEGVWEIKGDISGLGAEPAWGFSLGGVTDSKGYLADEAGNIWRFDPTLPLDSAWKLLIQLSVKVKGVLPFQSLEKVYFILEDGSMQLLDLSQFPVFSWVSLPETQPGTEDFIVLMTESPKRVFICKDNPALNALYREVWEFDPSSTGEKWKRMPDFPTYLFDGISFSFKEKAYMGMGQEAIGLTSPHLGYSLEMWEFIPPQ